MATADTACSIVPYFKIHSGRIEDFKAICERMVAVSASEPGCLYYGFSFVDDEAHCRESYADADGVLAHVANVGPLLQEALTMADLVRVEIHGPEVEIDKLREPMAGLAPRFFTLEYGFRR